jgi:hypothetical protein
LANKPWLKVLFAGCCERKTLLNGWLIWLISSSEQGEVSFEKNDGFDVKDGFHKQLNSTYHKILAIHSKTVLP